MAEDLTPAIVDQFDDVRYDNLNKTRRVVVTRYKLGRFGPFEHVCNEGECTESALRQAFTDKAATLRAFTP